MDSLELTKTGESDRNRLDSIRVMRYRSAQDLAIIRTLTEMTHFDFRTSREDLLRQANALQEVALEVSAIAWDELSLTYAQAQQHGRSDEVGQFANARLPVLLNLQSLLQNPVWQIAFGSGRFEERHGDRRNAERALEALADLRAT